jgi:hypothetical protein
MRTITINGEAVKISATPTAAIYYEDEFGTDIIPACIEISSNAAGHLAKTLRVIWALARNADDETPSFKQWVDALPAGTLDAHEDKDADVARRAVVDECIDGFFPSFWNRKGRRAGGADAGAGQEVPSD